MKRRQQPPEDKQRLILQFLKLSPAERMRYATGFVDSALRVNPDLLKYRAALNARERSKR
ncbi:MAG: hypothetical protein HY737_03255 [Candidatus Omnitrophica bacterium]|nr:hypothetical protein [Candidatus Omnitrophota bacterium]